MEMRERERKEKLDRTIYRAPSSSIYTFEVDATTSVTHTVGAVGVTVLMGTFVGWLEELVTVVVVDVVIAVVVISLVDCRDSRGATETVVVVDALTVSGISAKEDCAAQLR